MRTDFLASVAVPTSIPGWEGVWDGMRWDSLLRPVGLTLAECGVSLDG